MTSHLLQVQSWWVNCVTSLSLWGHGDEDVLPAGAFLG